MRGGTKPVASNWKSRKDWSDRFLPEIKQVLGRYLIGEPPVEEDAQRNTDLIVLKMEPVRIACRVRRHKFFLSCPGDFTIRTGLPSGAKTEMAKILEGWGDYFFYGFANRHEDALVSWVLCDLKVFRSWRSCYLADNRGRPTGQLFSNHDGSSDFRVFKVSELPKDFVVGRKRGLQPIPDEEWA